MISSLQEITDDVIDKILTQRTKILEAFIAETGLLPSECEQISQGNRWWVQKRSATSDDIYRWRAWRMGQTDVVHEVNKKNDVGNNSCLTTKCGEKIDMEWWHNPYSKGKITCKQCISKG